MSIMAGVILAGGAGKRLGGVVKPLLLNAGTPILATTRDKLRPHVALLLVSTGAIDPARFANFGCDALVPDRPDAAGGPLAGIFAAAGFLETNGQKPDWLISAAGDCPDLPADFPARLLDAVAPGIDVVFASYAGQSYPPNALWRFPALLTQMDTLAGDPQGRGPRHLMAQERRRDVDFSTWFTANPFAGLNDLTDLVALARRKGC